MPPFPNGKTALDMLLDQMTHVRDGQDDLKQAFADHRVESEHRLTTIEANSLHTARHTARGTASWVSLLISALVTALAALIGIPRAG